jgi:hypothetical protein
MTIFLNQNLATDPADHPLGPGQIFGIYAKGQNDGETQWVAQKALEAPQNKDRVFVQRNEFMYHGSE